MVDNTCSKCKQPCSINDQVKAFNQLYHYQCFTCEDCHVVVENNKYFFMEDQKIKRKIILCEIDYLKRSNSIICLKCNKPITSFSSNQQHYYHPECIQCPSCFTHSTYQYEYKGINYCRLHYSLLNETHCAGCDQAVLKQFVELKERPNQIWHPECYMIYKFWSIKLTNTNNKNQIDNEQELIKVQKETFKKVKRVWTDLSSFEESSANCISDMLLNVAAGAYTEGIRMANQFIMHLEVLFSALAKVQTNLYNRDLQCKEQSNLICKEMIRFFKLLSLRKSENSSITQQLLSLVTSLAQNLKYLIRIGLSYSQILEQEYQIPDAILQFLDVLMELDKKRVCIGGRYWFKDSTTTALSEEFNTTCNFCQKLIQNEDSFQSEQLQWHRGCFRCTACSTQLTLHNATLISSTLYCTACQPSASSSFTLSYSYQQSLQHLKIYLGKVSNELLVEKKTPNEMIMPKTKRQRSMLRLLSSKAPPLQDVINVGQIGHTSSTTLKPSSIHKNQSLHVSTTTVANHNEADSTTTSPTLVSSPKSPSAKINKLSLSIKRTFSTKNGIDHLFDENIDRRQDARYMASFTCSQDYILRHAAVIQIHNDLSAHFSLDELVSFMNPKKHPGAMWGKLLVHLRPHTSGTFGMPLANAARRDLTLQHVTLRDYTPALNTCLSDNATVPIFIKSCIIKILQSDMSVEGVFRKNGNIRQLKKVSESIDNLHHATMDEMEVLLQNENGVQLAALLKRYLRELPEPLFTYSLYKLFVHCGRMTKGRTRALHLACCLLPKPNRDTMVMLFCCLNWVSTFSDCNKMDIPNLARVIAPSVLYDKPSHSNAFDIQQGAQEEINVIETLIRHIDELAQVPNDLILFNLHDVHHDMSDLNSKYFITQYQKLLQEKKSPSRPVQIPSI